MRSPEGPSRSLDDLAALTPASRDRYVDFLRATSILAVVFGHWFIGIIWWRNGILRLTSAIGVTSWLWLGTWFFQVIPIFFFVGGFANYVAFRASRRRGDSTWSFVRGRVARLLKPSLVFVGIWAGIQVVMHVAGLGAPTGPRLWDDTTLLRGLLPPGATLPFGPLWFLGVYLVVVVISPVTIWLHGRFRLWVSAVMAAGALVVDVVSFGTGHWAWRWLNVAFVLLLPHQLGHFYGDGTLARQPRRLFWVMAIGGLAALFVLTNPPLFRLLGGARRFHWFPGIGAYPKSLLGTDVEVVSNAYPPTVPFMAAGIWSIGVAMLIRPAVSRWLQRARPWAITVAVNAVIMTLFLWHMTAYLIAILLLWPLGLGHEIDSTPSWWLQRPIWELLPAMILVVLVGMFGRFERSAHTPRSGRQAPAPGTARRTSPFRRRRRSTRP